MFIERRQEEGYGVGWDLVHIGQGLLGLTLLWDLIAGTINHVTGLVVGTQYLPVVFNIVWDEGLCELFVGPEICGVLKGCIAVAMLTYVVLKLVCWTEWVKEEVKWKDCWDETTWYNPWSWVKTVVCVTKTLIRWVLQKICGTIGIIVVTFAVVCIIIGLAALSST